MYVTVYIYIYPIYILYPLTDDIYIYIYIYISSYILMNEL